MKTVLALALAGFLVPAVASAAPERMYCVIDAGERGWIAEQLFLEVDADRNAAMVADPIILHFNEEPMEAKIGENTAKKLTLRWSVYARNSSGQQTKMAYRAAVLKSNNKVLVTAKPHGYGNSFSARGKCQEADGPLPGS